MNRPRGYHSSALLNNGRVLVSGGFSSPTTADWKDSEIYDPERDIWTMTGNMSSPRHNHLSISTTDGKVFILGGSNCQTGMCHSGIEVFDPQSGEWEDSHLLIIGRKWCNADLLSDDTIVVSGGKACNYPEPVTDMLIFGIGGIDGNSDNDRGDGEVYLIVVLLAISFILVNLVIKAHIRK
jgi:hypothetical protein